MAARVEPASRPVIVVVGCSRRKRSDTTRLPAVELYTGWCFPHLRRLIAEHRVSRSAVWVLSARHGLVHADDELAPYDEPLTPAALPALRDRIRRQAARLHPLGPASLLLLAEPLYGQAASDLLWSDRFGFDPVWWYRDPVGRWGDIERLLETFHA